MLDQMLTIKFIIVMIADAPPVPWLTSVKLRDEAERILLQVIVAMERNICERMIVRVCARYKVRYRLLAVAPRQQSLHHQIVLHSRQRGLADTDLARDLAQRLAFKAGHQER